MAPMRVELDPVVRRLGLAPDGHLFRGQFEGREWVAAASGMGANRVIAALTGLLEQHQCKRVILLGFAGGLDPALAVGAVPHLDWVIDGQGLAVRLTGDVPRMARDDDRQAGESTLLSVHEPIDSPIRKRQLHRQLRAAAVDMESFAVARYAAEHGVPLQVIRAISDTAREVLPTAAMTWVRPDGTTNSLAAAVWLFQHPWRLRALLQLQRGAAAAGQGLADAVATAMRPRQDRASIKP
jgi:adenosylhomocysteine nucleosidase